jgi:hypothetical protein
MSHCGMIQLGIPHYNIIWIENILIKYISDNLRSLKVEGKP